MKPFQDFSPFNGLHWTPNDSRSKRQFQCKLVVWNHLKPFEQFAVCTETVFWTLNRLVPSKVHYMEKNHGMLSSKTLISFRLKKERHILDDMGVSKLSANVFFFFFLK